jgi:hypothetical protein
MLKYNINSNVTVIIFYKGLDCSLFRLLHLLLDLLNSYSLPVYSTDLIFLWENQI